MKRTSAGVLILTSLAAGVLTFFVESTLQGAGMRIFVPPYTLGIALAAIGVILIVLALPVRQAGRGERRIDFRHATAVLGLAKASSIVAALFGGATVGLLGYLLTRPVVAGQLVVVDIVSIVGSLLLLVAALLAESWCVLPPDDDGHDGAAPEAA